MTCTLIISTYNRPDALRRVIESALNQIRVPDEIIIADDGSGFKTKETIKSLQKISKTPILHAWQSDEGFRAAMARNRAIALSSAEYLILIDGDMILHPYFMYDHLILAKEGSFLQGGRILLSAKQTKKMLQTPSTFPSLFSSGISNRPNTLRLPFLAKLIAKKSSQSYRGIRTCNFSLFKRDILRVNGFDNRFIGWGREDSELTARLFHSGIHRRDLKFCALTAHLYHPKAPRKYLAENEQRLERTLRLRSTRATDGLMRFLKEERSQ